MRLISKKRTYTPEQWERHKTHTRASYARHADKIRAQRKEDRKINGAKYSAYRTEYYKKNPEKYILMEAKRRAKRLGLEFDLEVSDIIIPEYCPIVNIKLTEVCNKGGAISSSPSLDRIDNNRGYLKDNVRVISRKANTCKSNLSLDDIKRLYNYSIGVV